MKRSQKFQSNYKDICIAHCLRNIHQSIKYINTCSLRSQLPETVKPHPQVKQEKTPYRLLYIHLLHICLLYALIMSPKITEESIFAINVSLCSIFRPITFQFPSPHAMSEKSFVITNCHIKKHSNENPVFIG